MCQCSLCYGVCLHSETTLKEQFSKEKSSLLQSIHNNSALISEKDLLVENLKSEVGVVFSFLPESWGTSTTNPVCLFPLAHTEVKAVKRILKSLPLVVTVQFHFYFSLSLCSTFSDAGTFRAVGCDSKVLILTVYSLRKSWFYLVYLAV